ncbi:MAG: 2OG-Fe(II) oxygenase [Bacteroidota bacterium]
MTIKIIDDVIPIAVQDEIERNVLDPRFPWCYIKSSDLGNLASLNYLLQKRADFQSEAIIDPGQFYHNILVDQKPGHFFQWFTPILDAISFEGMRVLRMKMNFNFPHVGSTDLMHGIPHVDLPNERKYTTGVYYVTDADGDTILFDQQQGYTGKLTIKQRVSPKKGRLVLFDGNTLHAACPPTSNSPRVLVNINIS